ncbi:MAG: hypothetical protein ACLGIF_01645, partial [Actinomycetes bacterium]
MSRPDPEPSHPSAPSRAPSSLDPVAPGQESVWDYPRPPALRRSDERIVVVLGGVEICETTA